MPFLSKHILLLSYAIFTTDKTQYLHFASMSWLFRSDAQIIRCMKFKIVMHDIRAPQMELRFVPFNITYTHPLLANQTLLFDMMINFKLSTVTTHQNFLFFFCFVDRASVTHLRN
jgi:hypothetical protein